MGGFIFNSHIKDYSVKEMGRQRDLVSIVLCYSMGMAKTKLFSIPRKDLELEFFRSGGNGGQKQNKTSSACRITHIPSGAVGESRDERQQTQNRKLALERLTTSPIFVAWVKVQAAMIEQGFRDLDQKVDQMMVDDNLQVELGVDCKKGEDVCDK
jgi:protein subunit release factor B